MKNYKDKEQALDDFLNNICKSWTYARLTHKERQQVIDSLCKSHLYGTYIQRWQHLHDIYDAFLNALDYKPSGWRETWRESEVKA